MHKKRSYLLSCDSSLFHFVTKCYSNMTNDLVSILTYFDYFVGFESPMNLEEGVQELQNFQLWLLFSHHLPLGSFCSWYSYSWRENLLTFSLQILMWLMLLEICHFCLHFQSCWIVFNLYSRVIFTFISCSKLITTHKSFGHNNSLNKKYWKNIKTLLSSFVISFCWRKRTIYITIL